MKIFSALFFSLILFSIAHADFTSTNFQVQDLTPITGGGESSSQSFRALGSVGQLSNSQSSSSSFSQNIGFFYFPSASSPIVSATTGDSQIFLNWTSSVGVLANVTSYDVGVSTSSGGLFTYTSVGNVLSNIKTGLMNGTQYFFKVRSYAAGVLLSESAVINATPVATLPPPPPSSGGGGGGGNNNNNNSSSNATTFSGRAYPSSTVTLLKDAEVLTSTVAGNDANFSINVNNLSAGSYIFSVYSEDNQGNRSSLLSFPVSITGGTSTNIGGIFLAPTISSDKTEVKKGDNITFFGQSVPKSEITIAIHSTQSIFKKTNTDNDGVYLQVVDSSILDLGDHSAMSKATRDGQISSDSKAISFIVGEENSLAEKKKKCPTIGNFNNDCKVNIIDFSIMAHWYKKENPPAYLDLNNDGVVNAIDFSIMAHYWTG